MTALLVAAATAAAAIREVVFTMLVAL